MKISGLDIFSIVAGLAICCGPASAQTVTGTIDTTITLTSACEVNGGTATSGVDFGTIDFGTHSTLFSEATSTLDPGGGGGGISIQCTPGADASLTITSGLNDAAVVGSGRAMAKGGLYVPYDIYSDASFLNLLANGSSIAVTADGTVQIVPIYGKALGNTGLTAGTYTDTISVTLGF